MKVLGWICSLPAGGAALRRLYVVQSPLLERELFGIKFPNPVGLAAGFDKDARWVDELSCLGFGFVEIGTVTPIAQDGNPQPRLFRLSKDQALINRMGFNNSGARAAGDLLKKRKSTVVIGGNIGKNKITDNANALNDYVICFKELHDHVDYFAVNVSSPNTPGLRALQDKEPLMEILVALKNENATYKSPKPILLKIAPDLTNKQLDEIIEIVELTQLDGVIATNTTISRESLRTEKQLLEKIGAGGLSGKPLTDRSTDVIKYLATKRQKHFAIIGVGGIHSEKDALDKLAAGADLIQLYTGFIYEGPSIVKRINKAVLESYKS